MSETKLTLGWKGPTGLCDMCRVKAAAYWFGDTSVALCGDEACAVLNAAHWQQALDEESTEL